MTDSDSGNKKDSKNSYKSILKGASIFGSVQVFLILVNLIRGKFVALFLGPEGMGISSLFSSASNTVVTGSTLGLNLAIVKEVSQHQEDRDRFANVLAVVFRLLRITSTLGALICVLFSRWLSELTFHSDAYTWQFVVLGVVVYFTIAGNGRLAILQGLHEVKRISRASLVGAVTGLVAGVPLYYFFGTRGIVPAMVILALSTYLFYYWNTRKITTDIRFRWKVHKPLAKKLLSLGLVLMAGGMIGTACNYALNVFLGWVGDMDSVGLYQAANGITTQYVGAVFAALSLDYFPRLSKAACENEKMYDVINRQSCIVALSMAPLASLMIMTSPIIIKVLLTDKFMPVLDLMRWMGLGIYFTALQFPLGYVAFAKDNKKVFLILEGIVGNAITFGGGMLCFYFWGLIGLGYSVIAGNIISLVIYYIVNRRLYGYNFNIQVVREYLIGTLVCLACFLASFWNRSVSGYMAMGGICMLSLAYSIYRIRTLIRKDRLECDGGEA